MADDTAPPEAIGSGNIRRVYALPFEMVARIGEFQREKGLTSEVEAVRRLLDEALMSRDDIDAIVNKILHRLGKTRIASEAARDVLVGHPLVKSVHFDSNGISFEMKDGASASVSERGYVWIKDSKWSPHDEEKPFAGGHSEMPF